MKRFLVALAIFSVVIYLLRRLAGTAGPGAGRARRPRRQRGEATMMVRDHVCNTFLPRGSALHVTRAGATHYFCSDACRDRFQATLADARRVS